MTHYTILTLTGTTLYSGDELYAAAVAWVPGSVHGSGETALDAWLAAEVVRARIAGKGPSVPQDRRNGEPGKSTRGNGVGQQERREA